MRFEDLRSRADRLFGDARLTDVLPAPTRAIVTPEIPDCEVEAQSALDKLRQNKSPTSTEMAALELVIRALRPAPRSINGELEDLPKHRANEPLQEPWAKFRKEIAPHLFSVGRIEVVPKMPIATGFLISPSVLVTNRHVADRLSYGTYQLEKGRAWVDFGKEYRSNPRPENAEPIPILSCIAIHPGLDMALLEIERQTGRAPFMVGAGSAAVGDNIVVLGYPMQDQERNPAFVDGIFQSAYNVKRASPGEVIGTRTDVLLHDCATLGGNSGSPVLSLPGASVVGLHQSGFFMYQNEAVTGENIAEFASQHV